MPLLALLLLSTSALAQPFSVYPLPFRLVSGETTKKPLPATTPGGIAVFDFDGDGLLDIFFPNGSALPSGPSAPHALLRNRGNFQFEDVTRQANLTNAGYSIAAIAADYDHDGRPDLLVCGLRSITLYHNNGNGRFTDVTQKAKLDNHSRWSVGAAFLDIDRDGDLDLFILNYVHWDPATERQCIVDGKPDFCHPRYYDPLPNALFRNNNDGTFTDISEASGIAAHKGKGMAVAAADFDGDGYVDLFVTNDRQFAFHFRNLGNGRFEEIAFESGLAVPQDGKPVSGMGIDAQDFDNDGRVDIVYTALRDETFPLYRNRGKDFQEATSSSRMSVLTRAMAGWGVVFADLDNDGFKDIAAARSDALSATGGKGASAMEPPAWFRNTTDGKFAAGPGFQTLMPLMYRGILAADFNNDGCLDLVFTALNAPARILRNTCPAGANWIKVDVRQPGARIRVNQQWRYTGSTLGYASSYLGPAHFGLGKSTQAEIEVLFLNGKTVKLSSPANRTVLIQP